MTPPKPEQFSEFYEAIHGYAPFPWQSRLAERVCTGTWPQGIALPTASGKTGCIDVAVFALACQVPNAARRIFFVVDRRIVVDQAYEHAKKLACALHEPEIGILKTVADSLRQVAGVNQDQSALDYYALRGGMYRESAWARSPLQPTVIASTVDQVGSRLLFRGYGVSDSMKPIHAALVSHDSLILLDEAHCAQPFDQTMQAVKKYLGWHATTRPFTCVSMTATPRDKDDILRDEAADRNHPVLGERFRASKPAKLVVADKAKGQGKSGTMELVKVLETQARELAKSADCVGIIVNRVKTARELKAKLGPDAVLLTGRMRPLDRDRIYDEKLQSLLSSSKLKTPPPKFVIGTQCLECGADFDFHALLTECASLDALRQRFGRLNRVAKRDQAKAVIVIRGDQATDSLDDPVYGDSLANTWKWLSEKATHSEIDFGILALRDLLEESQLLELNAPTDDAPVLFPAHLDCWVQTHPVPTPDPDPALFLHGPKRPGQPDVQVVFRSDLGTDPTLWSHIVALCPPSSSEAVAVPISLFKKWLAGLPLDDQTSDVSGEVVEDAEKEPKADQNPRMALHWRGPEKSAWVNDARPNQTYVIRCDAEQIHALADFGQDVPAAPTDHAEEAFLRSRDKPILRLPQSLLKPEDEDFEELLTAEIQARIEADFPGKTGQSMANLLLEKRRTATAYPNGGWVVVGKQRLNQFVPEFWDDDDSSYSPNQRSITLEEHSLGVAETARQFAEVCGLDGDLFYTAGLWHDLGKLDPRFQAMLKQSSPRTAVGEPWAKSIRSPRSLEDKQAAREVHRYPAGARHELLSTAMLASQTSDEMLLHLVATHHGSGRPFADAVEENEAAKTPFETKLFGQTFALQTSSQTIEAWNAELPERFWRMVRKQGWWGCAFRETLLRLADHQQSRNEQEMPVKSTHKVSVTPLPARREVPTLYPLELPGLDGSNPLAFLAALGLLNILDQASQKSSAPSWLTGPVALSFDTPKSTQTACLHFSEPPPDQEPFLEFIHAQLATTLEQHPSWCVVEMLVKGNKKDTVRDFTPIKNWMSAPHPEDQRRHNWITALACESVLDADSQLQTVRCDYLIGNLKSLFGVTTVKHLSRTLFLPWDYADGLANQSLHWEPTEDRRHAYQWYMPSGDPTRSKRGGMVGANRLAFEAWPLFPSFPDPKQDRVFTRGFLGNRANNTFFRWPLWRSPRTTCSIASLLALESLQKEKIPLQELYQTGVCHVFSLQRILVGKTPNFTTAVALM
jgi:CRISPR-associated endonuclease/helicase Cas3